MRKYIFLAATASTATAFVANAAYAQSEAPAATTTAASAEASDSSGIGDIVVTAQKRSENLQKIPISIVAASGEQLKSAGITDSTKLNAVVPGLNIRTSVGSFQPYIRGIGTSASIVENPVALYIDGVYYAQQKEGTREFNDIAQIAVLKGPQGTLFGRNATGGVIQITTKAPSHTWGGEVNTSYDNYETIHVDSYLTGPLSENLAFSLSGAYTHQGQGWGKNVITGNDTNRLAHQFGTRGKLLWEPGPDTKFTLIGDYTDRFAYTFSVQPYPGTTLNYVGKKRVDGSVVTLPTLNSKYDTGVDLDPAVGFKGGGVSLTGEQDVGLFKLTSITSWRRGNGYYRFDTAMVSPQLSNSIAPNQISENFTQELQAVTTGHGPFTLAGGLFYYWYDYHSLENQRLRVFPYPATTAALPVNQTLTQGKEVTRSFAPFIQGDWEFLPQTKLTLGARYTYEKRTLVGAVYTLQGSAAAKANPTILNAVPPLKANKFTYRIALSHDFTNTISAYASYNTGFKSGGFNILSPTAPAYLPETLKAAEAGLKSQFFDHKLRLNVAGFLYDYTNIQVSQFSPPPILSQVVSNAAKAKLYGVDIDFEARPFPDLRFSGGIELLHAEFTDYPGAPFNNTGDFTGKTTNVGPIILPDGTLKNARGYRLPLAQKYVANLAADYHVKAGDGDLDFNLTFNFNGNYYFEADNFAEQKAYTMINASARYTFPNGRLSVMAWGKNLADKKIITYVTSSSGIGYPTMYGNAPLTYGGTVSLKF